MNKYRLKTQFLVNWCCKNVSGEVEMAAALRWGGRACAPFELWASICSSLHSPTCQIWMVYLITPEIWFFWACKPNQCQVYVKHQCTCVLTAYWTATVSDECSQQATGLSSHACMILGFTPLHHPSKKHTVFAHEQSSLLCGTTQEPMCQTSMFKINMIE